MSHASIYPIKGRPNMDTIRRAADSSKANMYSVPIRGWHHERLQRGHHYYIGYSPPDICG